MAAIKQDFGIDTAITITLASLADDGEVTSSAIDLGDPGPFALSIEAKLDGNTASATSMVEIYAAWSNENTDFSDNLNDNLVGTVQLNGVTAVIKVFGFPVIARYLKLRVLNKSGAALTAAGNTLRYVPITVDQT